MRLGRSGLLALAAAAGLSALSAAGAAWAQANGQFVPLLVYRTGPYAPSGTPIANGSADYFNLVNERDGGVGGVKITWEECETAYNNDRGVECYERLKKNGPTGASVVSPFSTGITYALVEKATADKIPLLTLGYGRTDAADGRVFPYVFPIVATYWNQATAFIKHLGEREGGMDKLKGKNIALVYHDSAYGKEPIATFEKLSADIGYKFHKFAVAHPGLEQKATWLQIGRQLRPDYVIMWGWGVMNSTAIKEAAAVGYPMDKFYGVWWSSSEADVEPAGAAAKGYRGGTFHAPGADFPVHADILKHVHDKGKGSGPKDEIGEVLYNRGVINSMLIVESIRTAQEKFGRKPLTGEQVRWGIENLDLTADRLKALGMQDMMEPIKLSCADHEGKGRVRLQQWDGQAWKAAGGWIDPMWEVTRPLVEASAAAYAKEKGITPRDCSKEG